MTTLLHSLMTNTKLLKQLFMVSLWTRNGPVMLRRYISGLSR